MWFSTKSNCDRHLLRKHGVTPDPTETPADQLQQAYTLRNTPERPFKCNLCSGSSFSSEENLSKHKLERHSKPEPEVVVQEDDMDVSILRDDTDDENDAVSDSNLSDVQVIEEFPEVELEKTEKILEKMGGKPVPSPGGSFSELCGDIEMMLNPTTSTPSRNVSRTSTASTHSSMPPLEELSSSATSDSGNATDVSEPPATPASLLATADTVTVNLEDRFLVNNLLIMNNIFCSRTTSSTSEPRDKKQSTLSMMCTILHNELLFYLFNLFRHLVFNHVSEIFRNYYVQRVSVHRNFALGK